MVCDLRAQCSEINAFSVAYGARNRINYVQMCVEKTNFSSKDFVVSPQHNRQVFQKVRLVLRNGAVCRLLGSFPEILGLDCAPIKHKKQGLLCGRGHTHSSQLKHTCRKLFLKHCLPYRIYFPKKGLLRRFITFLFPRGETISTWIQKFLLFQAMQRCESRKTTRWNLCG